MDELIAGKIELAARSKIELLMGQLAVSNLLDRCYAYKSRIKSAEKQLAKKELKLNEGRNYSLTDITDIIGIRFVTLFRQEMAEIVEKVLSLIDHSDEISPNPFDAGWISEIIVFRGNVNSDQVLDDIVANIKDRPNVGEKLQEKNSSEGYSSIHIVTRLSDKIDLNGTEYYLPVEIQIRTVFEDAWGEIDHKYGYVMRTGKHSGEPIHNPTSVLAHLKVLKKFSDACADYADVIHREASEDLSGQPVGGKMISVGWDGDIINRFKDLGVNSELISRYVSARSIKLKAVTEEGSALSQSKHSQAAEAFRELSRSDQEAHALFKLYSQLNEAFCLLSVGSTEDIYAAKVIYTQLKVEHPDYPIVFHRLGQVDAKLGKIDAAIDSYETAWGMLCSYEKIGKIGGDELPTADYEHIKTRLPGIFGYSYWRKSIDAKTESERYTLLKKALDVTKPALNGSDPTVLLSAHNNSLYYLLDIYKYCSSYTSKNNLLADIQSHLAFMESQEEPPKLKKLSRLDTYAKAFSVLGRKQEAIELLELIISLVLSNKVKDVSGTEALEVAQDAKALLDEQKAL